MIILRKSNHVLLLLPQTDIIFNQHDYFVYIFAVIFGKHVPKAKIMGYESIIIFLLLSTHCEVHVFLQIFILGLFTATK